MIPRPTSTLDRRIIAPMAWGNGAYVVHRLLEAQIREYAVASYHPRWTLFPFVLGSVASTKGASIVHTTPDYGLFFSRQKRPLVLTIHNYVLDPWMRQYSTWMQRVQYATHLRLFTLLSLKKAAAITAVSRYTARITQEDLGLSLPVRVIYNGIDSDRFTPAASRSTEKEVRVFFSGNITTRKGAHWLPEIAHRLGKNIRIFYTHGLRGKNTLKPMPNLQPIGSVDYENMPERYRHMDILLMPTVREGFSLSMLEAMASGLPVVASDCSSLPEQIDHGKGGFLCPVGDVDFFAEKINLLAESPALRQEMGEYNRARVEKDFKFGQMIENFRLLFEETLDSWNR